MPAFAILRQGHTPSDSLKAIGFMLEMARFWDPADGEILQWAAPVGWFDTRDAFARVAEFIEKARGNCRGVPLTLIVDEINPSSLSPMTSGGWSSLIAMLILAFPDVHWVFMVVNGFPAGDPATLTVKSWEDFASDYGLGSLTVPRTNPLFDGHRLRQFILRQMKARCAERRREGKADDCGSIPIRPHTAVVLDEEKDYSLFISYMVYAHGFCVRAVGSWAEALAVCAESERFTLSIEDWYLNFPDQSQRGMSQLERRQNILPALTLSHPPHRRFVTVGHEWNKVRKQERDAYLADLRARETVRTGIRLRKSHQRALKPASGIYTLWKELGLRRAFPNSGQPDCYRGLAPGYFWPPPKLGDNLGDDPDDEGDGHSSSGRLLQIAEHLIARATAMIDEVNTVGEAVRGAVLATQAMELLGCKTPTLSVAALALKHEFEIVAECQFIGVEYHLSMKERLKDLEEVSLDAMSHWLHPRRRAEFCLNNEAKILTRLVAALDKYGEYEESETCQIRLRNLHRKIGFNYDLRNRRLFHICMFPVNLYIDIVFRSLIHYAVVIFVFLSIFVAAYWCFDKPTLNNLPQSFHSVVGYMVGALPESTRLPGGNGKNSLNSAQMVIMYLCLAFGILNFGLIVSHLYSKMIRK